MSVRHRALTAVWIAVVAWSASSLLVRAGHSDALVFTTWRLWFALPPLAAIVWWRRRRNPDLQLWPAGMSRARGLLVLAGGGAFFASSAATAFAAMTQTRLLDVTLIMALQPVLIIGFAVVWLGERITVQQAVLPLVAVGGTVVVAAAASSSGSWSLMGELLAVVSLVLNAGWFLYGRVLRARSAVDPIAVMLGVLGSAAVLLTPVTLVVHGGLHISSTGLFFAACTMVTGTAAHVLMIWAHRFLPASVSAPLLLAEPPLVAIGAWIWFDESLGAVEILASAVVVATLVALVRTPALEHVEEVAADPVAPT